MKMIRSQATLTGVQPKMEVESGARFILKLSSKKFPNIAEVEDLTMHLAALAGIPTVPHSLLRLPSGDLAYITKRIDRRGKAKLHMEDMCQLTSRPPQEKYEGSYEEIAATIRKYSDNYKEDIVRFYEQVLFSFLTGNADMHLKNFSLISLPRKGYTLAPAYDMVAMALVNPGDDEDLALMLNGKKKNIKEKDFLQAFDKAGMNRQRQNDIILNLKKSKSRWLDLINISFLSRQLKADCTKLVEEKFARLGWTH